MSLQFCNSNDEIATDATKRVVKISKPRQSRAQKISSPNPSNTEGFDEYDPSDFDDEDLDGLGESEAETALNSRNSNGKNKRKNVVSPVKRHQSKKATTSSIGTMSANDKMVVVGGQKMKTGTPLVLVDDVVHVFEPWVYDAANLTSVTSLRMSLSRDSTLSANQFKAANTLFKQKKSASVTIQKETSECRPK